MKLVIRGDFLLETPEEELWRQMMVIEHAGRTCYKSVRGPITQGTATRFVRMLIKGGHESVLEHGSFTVRFVNCSRGFTHELVRHRLAAFSQESTRYVDYAKGKVDLEAFQLRCVLPPHRNVDEKVRLPDGRELTPVEMLEQTEVFYRALRQAGWLPEDARQLLPTAVVAEIVMTANFREWRHIFEKRTEKVAHWEIRGMMGGLLEYLKGIIPVFDDFVRAGEDKYGLAYYEKVPL